MIRTLIKRAVMWLYCHEYISGRTVTRMFKRFDLWSA
jgi:hypothetical protein